MAKAANRIAELLLPAVVAPGGDAAEPPSAARLLAAGRVLVLDLEMSGANPKLHEVLEIGAVLAELAEGFPELGSFGTRVRPRHIGNADHAALRIVGYSPRLWKGAPTIEESFPRLLELGRGAIATGWGVSQDLAFLHELLRRAGEEWPFAPFVVDVQRLARRLLTRGETVERFNLGHVADRLGIGRMGEHSALADAYATYDLLQALVRLAAEGAGDGGGGSSPA